METAEKTRLNAAQQRAVSHDDQPLLVIAGAGTGKTTTLAHRVAHLVSEGADPARILLLTFTRRAAEEMTRRAERILRESSDGADLRLPWAGTFHSVANRLLRRFAGNLGLDPGFSVLDQSDAADLLDVVRHDQGLTAVGRRFPKKNSCLAIYSRCMNTGLPLATVLKDAWPWCVEWQDELKTLFRSYVERKQATQSLDYDDLLAYWALLMNDAELARDVGGFFDHVLVDEYQDTNVVQAGIVRALKPDGRGVTVVGDDAQSIYAFRAASVENILEFPGQYSPRASVVKLEDNYRSVQPVLDAANTLLRQAERQYEKNLRSTRPAGGQPKYMTVEDGDAEADYIVETVLENHEAGIPLREQAVLFRNSHHSDRLEVELTRRNIPYVKYGGLKFLEAAHVKDVLGVLKWADNPKNEIAAYRTLKLMPGIGPRLAARAWAHLASSGFDLRTLADFEPGGPARDAWSGFCGLMSELRREPDAAWQLQFAPLKDWYRPLLESLYDSADTRFADIEQLEQISARYASRERFLTELTLDPPSASGDQSGPPMIDEDYLILSTVHSAKGQEWEQVFILNVTDGNFPNEFSTGSREGIEEERRLLYVAMTRAKNHLSLMAPLRFYVTQQQRHGDGHVYGARSRFVTDELMSCFDAGFYGESNVSRSRPGPSSDRQVDAAAVMRDMW